MFDGARPVYGAMLAEIRAQGLYKAERVIEGPQGPVVRSLGRYFKNFCSNNYLGLCSHPDILRAATEALVNFGYGLSSVRFISGTQDKHKELEATIARYFSTDDTILYSSCFDANAGVFEALLADEDAVLSDALNHASLIDGIRLCKAERLRYAHGDMDALEKLLQATAKRRLRLIATDGVFSMDGELANLNRICDLADRYRAMVLVDDSHATGFLGPTGRGTPELCGVESRVDIVTSTFGKALGGASGGFATGRRELIDLLRQRSRPYLFSNSLAPVIVGATLAVFDVLLREPWRRVQVMDNAHRFRAGATAAGFTIKSGFHPIVPVMLGDARRANDFAEAMLDEGIYVVGFSYPVVPEGEARVRVQLSAAHTDADVDAAVAAFCKVGRRLGVIASGG